MYVLDRAAGTFMVSISFDLWLRERLDNFAVLIRGPFVCIGSEGIDFAFEFAMRLINTWISSFEEWHS